jgi:hypothetical protein
MNRLNWQRGCPMQSRFEDRLGPRSAVRLLGISLGRPAEPAGTSEQAIRATLDAQLESIWDQESGQGPIWSQLLRRLRWKDAPDRLRTIEELLLDRQTDLAVIRAVRDYAKAKAAGESSEASHAAMTTIYFAATASALVHHGERITTYPYDALATSFRRLLTKTWMPEALVDMLRKAAAICRQRQ